MTIEDQLRRSLADQASRIDPSPRAVARWEAAARHTRHIRPPMLAAAAVLTALVSVAAVVAALSDDKRQTVTAGPDTSVAPIESADCPEPSSSTPSPRSEVAMAPDNHGIILFGGNDGRAFLGDTWRFACGRWSRLMPPSAPPADGRPLAVFDADAKQTRLVAGDGSVWAWAGADWQMLAPGGSLPKLTDPHMVYDTAAKRLMLVGANGAALETWAWQGGAWTRLASTDGLGLLRQYGLVHHAALTKTVLFGGVMDGDMLVSTTYVWNGKAWTPAGTANGDAPQAAVTAAYDDKAKVIVAVDDLDARTWLWDGDWKLAPAAGPGRRWEAGAAFDGSTGGVIFFGGQYLEPRSAEAPRLVDDAWKWDGTSWVALPAQRE